MPGATVFASGVPDCWIGIAKQGASGTGWDAASSGRASGPHCAPRPGACQARSPWFRVTRRRVGAAPRLATVPPLLQPPCYRANGVSLFLLAIVASTALTGCAAGAAPPTPPIVPGSPGAPREVNLIARDYSFVPATLDLVPGETILLHVINGGLVVHEALLGDAAVQDAWEVAEAATVGAPPGPTPTVQVPPDVAGVRIVVRSGERVDLTWTVPADAASAPTPWVVGCHIPGHWAKGMQIPIQWVTRGAPGSSSVVPSHSARS
jgi:uncharacterized cupredoxin-like copper-binding protein